MNRLTAALAALLIGGVLGYVAGLMAPDAKESDTSPAAQTDPLAHTSKPELVKQLHAQTEDIRRLQEEVATRDERIQRQKEQLDSYEKRLLEQSVSNATAGTKVDLQALTPEEIAAEAESLRARFTEAFDNRDRDSVMEVIKALKALGPAAYPELVQVLNAIEADRTGENTLQLPFRYLFQVIGQDKELLGYLVQSGDAATTLRTVAIRSLGWTSGKDATPIFLGALQGEQDEGVVAQLARQLGRTADLSSSQPIIDALQNDYENPRTTRSLLLALANAADAEAADTLQFYATQSDDESIREAANTALTFYSSETDGFGVTSVREETPAAAAGLQPGDVIVSYNQQPVTEAFRLRELQRRADRSEPVTIEYVRDGVVQSTTVDGGRLGVRGQQVSKQD